MILHIAIKSQWEESLDKGYYGEPLLEKDKFIHCSEIENVVDVANGNDYLRNVEKQMVILCVDEEKLKAEVKYEQRGKLGIKFPHIYGLINVDAVIDVVDLNKDVNGDFIFPDKLIKYVKYEKSCGAIIIDNSLDAPKVLLIKHVNGEHMGFPKGHVEGNETEVETAIREIKEETSLNVLIDNKFRYVTRYFPKKGVIKDVIYFIATPINNDIKVQDAEILGFKWCTFDEAEKLITYRANLLAFRAAKEYFKVEKYR